MTKLSIIIPCYNCERTLEAAVDSVYRQRAAVEYDVTMVDDSSTDGTFEIMKLLARRHPRIKLAQHSANLGGGAARNTGVANSRGDLIFCLDADDIMGPDLLRKLTDFWLVKRSDVVGIGRSIKFRKDNLADIAYVNEFARPGERIHFEALLDGSDCSLYSTFLMTRSAFSAVGGYPTLHAFDTQGMAFRVLGNGLSAYTCPEAVYYHRVEFQESYYLRELRARRINWNWVQVLDEFLYLFRPKTQRMILNSPDFSSGGHSDEQDLIGSLRGDRSIYARNYRSLVRIGWKGAALRFRNRRDRHIQYWLGGNASRQGDYRLALEHYVKALEMGFDFPIIYYRILEAAFHLSGRQIPTPIGLARLLQYCQPPVEEPRTASQRLFHMLMRSDLLAGPTRQAKKWKDALLRGEEYA